MVVGSFSVNKQNYNGRLGEVTNHRIISEYSVNINREVRNDRSNAKYLIEGNIRDGVYFDLTHGLSTFTDKGIHFQDLPHMTKMCNWAVAQPGATIKEVFDGADFATRRGTMKRMAMTVLDNPWRGYPSEKDAWTVVAQDFGGVILISEQSREYDGNRFDLATYSGFKFEQYMTADEPNGRPDINSPIDNRVAFEMMVRTDLVDGQNKIKLCCGAEVDALRGDEPIELKTAFDGKSDGLFRNVVTVIQSEIVGVRSIVTGIKRGDTRYGVLGIHKVFEKQVHDIKSYQAVSNEVGKAYAFIFDVLTQVKRFMKSNEACEVSYDPFKQTIEIKSISGQEAKDNGNGVTDEFMARFNIMQRSEAASHPIESSLKAMEELTLKKTKLN